MRKKAVLICVAVFTACLVSCGKAEDTSCRIVDLKVDYKTNPMGIEENPVFGWRMESEAPDQIQRAYRIVVGESPEALRQKQYVWDSTKILSDLSVAIPYEGEPLEPEQDYYWQVYVWDRDDVCRTAAETAVFETGILDDDWANAAWIGAGAKRHETTADGADSYTITYDVRMENTSSGLVWGVDTNEYGSYCRLDFDTRGDGIELAVSELTNDQTVNETRLSLSEAYPESFGDKEQFCTREHHVELAVRDRTVEVAVDGIAVAHAELTESKAVGRLGLWTARGAYYAYYDNIRAVDSSGEIIYSEGFEEKDNNLFSPYYTKITDGWCEASAGYLLMPGGEEPAPMLRKSFMTGQGKEIASARLYASAFGSYDIFVNGRDICDEYMAPGRSVYHKEVYYRTYDITDFLNQQTDGKSENTIGVLLGHGRYNRAKSDWGENLAFCAKLVIKYTDGSAQTIITDRSWKVSTDGPIRNDDMFSGEYYDAGFECADWTGNGFDEDGWQQAEVFAEYDGIAREPAVSEPVRCIEERRPVSVSEPEPGVYVYDFGQNFNGNCHIVLNNTEDKKGRVVTIRYAEALNEADLSCRDDGTGTIWTQNLYTADNTDYYVIGGKGQESFTPTFVYRGFRYVQISGLEEAIPAEDIKGLVISADNHRTGYFRCSDAKINRLYESIYWTQLSNYTDIPTDCPQRDERFGWAGDAQVFAHTADYNADIYCFMKNYLDMLIQCQGENGAFPEIAPSMDAQSSANGWSDAGIILVWELYQQYGNPQIIRENLDAMCRYMDYLVETSDDFIRKEEGYGDHNAVSGLDDDIANTAQCAYVAHLLSQMAKIAGENGIAARYADIYEQYKEAWQRNDINEDGSIDCWLQSAYTLGLAFGLYPEALEEEGAACLNNAIVWNDYHLNTGYIATPFLLPVLCRYGYTDTAYRILMQDTYPSWNNMLSKGGTTLTESWYTYYETGEGTYAINGSLNHLGLGSVGEWLYSDLLGIKRDEQSPAYKHFYLEPRPGGGLTFASGSFESPYGTIESSWQVEGTELVFRFTIPANTSASVSLPDEKYRNMELGSGEYEFRVKIK